MASYPNTRTDPLFQKDGELHKHKSTTSSVQPLSSLPQDLQSLFKAPYGEPYILTTPSTIFHAQGGGQPSDTGTIKSSSSSPPHGTGSSFTVHQVRKVDPVILHLGVFDPPETQFDVANNEEIWQAIDVRKRVQHSRLHTGGHVIGLAIALLKKEGRLPADIIDGKASHYPGAAFVEFSGLIQGTSKADIQAKVDELVALDLPVKIHFWDEQRAKSECTGVLESDNLKGDEDGVRVVEFGDAGSYPCGGTHVLSLKGVGKVVVRNIKRQKGVSKISYEVQDV